MGWMNIIIQGWDDWYWCDIDWINGICYIDQQAARYIVLSQNQLTPPNWPIQLGRWWLGYPINRKISHGIRFSFKRISCTTERFKEDSYSTLRCSIQLVPEKAMAGWGRIDIQSVQPEPCLCRSQTSVQLTGVCHKPPMTGNGEHTNYLWWWLGDALWHCYTHINAFHGDLVGSLMMPVQNTGGPCHIF